MRTLPFLATASSLLAILASGEPSPAEAAPQGITTRPLDLDLSAATVTNVFNLLSEVTGRAIVVDPCVHGSVDLRLKNTPTPLVFDALAMKLSLAYEEEGDRIRVRCANGGDEHEASVRVTLDERGAALRDVASKLASSAGLDGVDYLATRTPRVTLAVEGVRLSTVLVALGEESGLKLAVARGKLVVRD